MSDVKAVDQLADFEQRWLCEPPSEGTSFRVIRDAWTDDLTIRTISEWVSV